MNERLASSIERFERLFLFRAARILPLGFGALGAVMIVLAALGLAYSVMPAIKGKPPLPNPSPPEVAVTRADVANHLRLAAASRSSAQETPTATPAAGTRAPAPPSSDATAIASKLHALRQLVAQRNLAWANETEAYCESQYFGSCYRWGTRVTRAGAGPIVLEVLARYNAGDRVETVSPPGVEERYRINSTGSATKLRVLDEITTILRQAPGEEIEMIRGWGALRRDREQARSDAISAEQARVATAAMEIEVRHVAAVAKRAATRWTSTRLLVGALGVLFMTGVALAVLAIERNTRAIQRLATNLSNAPGSA